MFEGIWVGFNFQFVFIVESFQIFNLFFQVLILLSEFESLGPEKHGLKSGFIDLLTGGFWSYQFVVLADDFLAFFIDTLDFHHHDFEKLVLVGFHSFFKVRWGFIDYWIELVKVVFDLVLQLIFGQWGITISNFRKLFSKLKVWQGWHERWLSDRTFFTQRLNFDWKLFIVKRWNLGWSIDVDHWYCLTVFVLVFQITIWNSLLIFG